MKVAVQMEFRADRKDPLAHLVRRVAAELGRSGLVPEIVATFSDGPGGIRIASAVERALKKHPHLARARVVRAGQVMTQQRWLRRSPPRCPSAPAQLVGHARTSCPPRRRRRQRRYATMRLHIGRLP